MEFRILGPLEVSNGRGPVALPGQRLRALLALFLLHPNAALSPDRLAQALWGEDAPAASVTTVRVHVSRLRRALDGDAELLTTSPAGYRLRVRPGELDSERFADLVETARGAGPEAAGEALREALALWRGPPLADLVAEPFLGPVIARLEDERLDALELRVAADLATGRHAELVAELQALTATAPQRERLHAQLMLALYRSGRQTEALEAYHRLRAELVDALGIEPGVETRELEAAILRQDPALDLPSPVSGEAGPGARRRRSSALIVLVAVATAMAVIADRGTGDPAQPAHVYRAQIVRVCDAINAAERERLHDEDRLRRAVLTRPASQKVAILTATRALISRDGRNLADLRSIAPPEAQRAQHVTAAYVWDRNLDRIRRFAVHLDRAGTLQRAIAPLVAARPAIERDRVTLIAGLQRLGGERCQIHAFSERPVLLPPLGPDVNPPPTARPRAPTATSGDREE